MGDPISIAGTAVGITSLGIQVCQELVKFYSDYRNYRKDIDSIVRKAEGLDGILRVLGNVKSNIKIENDEASKLLQGAFQACDDALRKLKQRVTECNMTSIPGSMKDRVLLAKSKLLWPFKKNTVIDMQKTLDGLQENLSLALQIMSV